MNFANFRTSQDTRIFLLLSVKAIDALLYGCVQLKCLLILRNRLLRQENI